MCLISEGRGNRGEKGRRGGEEETEATGERKGKIMEIGGIMVRDEEWGKWKG